MSIIHPLNVWPVFIFIIILFICIIIIRGHYVSKDSKVYRQQILTCRVCIFLPVYALLIYIGLLSPYSLSGLLIILVIEEAIAFYSFASLVVYNVGGAGNLVKSKIHRIIILNLTITIITFIMDHHIILVSYNNSIEGAK